MINKCMEISTPAQSRGPKSPFLAHPALYTCPNNLYPPGPFGLRQVALLREALQAFCSYSPIWIPRQKRAGVSRLLGELEGLEFRERSLARIRNMVK